MVCLTCSQRARHPLRLFCGGLGVPRQSPAVASQSQDRDQAGHLNGHGGGLWSTSAIPAQSRGSIGTCSAAGREKWASAPCTQSVSRKRESAQKSHAGSASTALIRSRDAKPPRRSTRQRPELRPGTIPRTLRQSCRQTRRLGAAKSIRLSGKQTPRRLPIIGHLSVGSVNTGHITKALGAVRSDRSRKPQVAFAAVSRPCWISRRRMAGGRARQSARWRGHLDTSFPSRPMSERLVITPTPPCRGASRWPHGTNEQHGVSVLALRFAHPTTRTSEVLGLAGQQIDQQTAA